MNSNPDPADLRTSTVPGHDSHHKDRSIMISLWPGYKITKETKSELISFHTDGNYKPNGASEEGTMKHWLSFFLRGSFLTKGPGALSWLQNEHLDGNGL